MVRLFIIGLIAIASILLLFHAIKALVFVAMFGVLVVALGLLWRAVAPPTSGPNNR